ncbi:MAG: ferrous iron transport protein B [Verrucomicrobia bacterium]|nr:ferrous iron transport protein B [Verrucomicrobiota bacterium]
MATGAPFYVVVTGNPNCGKTTVFNALTGLRAKVGNYPGVTVERKEGRMLGAPADLPVMVLDLPGTYSLSPQSLDEQIVRDVLYHRVPAVPPPQAVVLVVDASNLQRNLYFATQVIELGYPTIVALNMIDVAHKNGHEIDAAKLGEALGVPVMPVVASSGQGMSALREKIVAALRDGRGAVSVKSFCKPPSELAREVSAVAKQIAAPVTPRHSFAEALLLLSDDKFIDSSGGHYPPATRQTVEAARRRLEEEGVDWRSAAIESRYSRISAIQQAVTTDRLVAAETFSDRLDRVLTHKVWGLLVFVVVLTVIFQSIFTFAKLPMKGLEQGVDFVGQHVGALLPPGALNSLVIDGIIAGVGAVVVFLPQICLLFLFLGLLEDTGYMARAAFLMDRVMSKVGLHGKSFIPMLSSFACAIPGIMATRTIENPRDRLVTVMISPLMSCSARLPVYTVLIAACIPETKVLGFVRLPGVVLFTMYALGILVALVMAWLFKKTLLRGPAPMLIMELPPYKRPLARTVLRHVWDRAQLFLTQAGTIILAINIVLWFLVSYPKNSEVKREFDLQRAAVETKTFPGLTDPKAVAAAKADALAHIDIEEKGATLRGSFAGHMGRALEPILRPLGFDWKIGIGIISSFAAREVFVSTMSQVYNVGGYDDTEEGTQSLAAIMREQKRPDGSVIYTPLLGLTLMVFYVFALQCASTVAVVRRETNSWKWPAIQWLYMGVLAWTLAFLTWHGGKLLGWG